MTQDMNHTFVKTLRAVLVTTMMSLTGSYALAQVTVSGNVYGGGNLASVGGSCTVKIDQTGAKVTGDVYGGGAKAYVNSSDGSSATAGAVTSVTLSKGTVNGGVYGGGLGALAVGTEGQDGYEAPKPADVYGAVTVIVEGGKAGNVFGCNNILGAPQSTVEVNINSTDNVESGDVAISNVYGGGNQAAYTGTPVVTMSGGTVGNVYGGGLGVSASVAGTSVTMKNGTAEGDTGGTAGNIFGGGEQAPVTGSVVVNIQGGTVTNDVYGGGALADTNTDTNTTFDSNGKQTYPITTVNLTGGTIGNAYGGALGSTSTAANVWGDVTVTVNGTAFTITNESYTEGEETVYVPKTGRVFGCNNIKGSPKREVTVHVIKTVPVGGGGHNFGSYEIAAVYGGGNMAAYEPTKAETESTDDEDFSSDDTKASTNVIIDGCEDTSIETVYGGGNAASTPSTKVTVNGAFEIGELFGGGNGKDKIKQGEAWEDNPGAHVGFKAYTTESEKDDAKYGSGQARVNIYGGKIHAVYGGSNTLGNVRRVAVAMLDEVVSTCPIAVDEAYGGGKSADMDGRAILNLGCIPGIGSVYGGARAAKVNNDVVLTITNGTYNNVFGGNNESGDINGSITVNVEETGCRPIHITNLYGGGNEAPYPGATATVADANKKITVNVKSCTSIGNVFGGGLGTDAVVTGNTEVNINQVEGKFSTTREGYAQNTYGDAEIEGLGTIGNVYGGGSQGNVVGNTSVNIGTASKVAYVTGTNTAEQDVQGVNITGSVYGGGLSANVVGNSEVQIGTVTLTAENATGIKIAKDVFGGGEGKTTNVSGNVKVEIGKDNGNNTYSGDATIGTSTYAGSVYGGSALGSVNTQASGSTPASGTVTVNLHKGTVKGAVYGGGMGEASVGENSGTEAKVFGNATVTLYGDVVTGGLYGGCNLNGIMYGNTILNLYGGTVGTQLAANATAPDMVFGGGLGKDTKVNGNVTVNIGDADNAGATIYSNVYGGSAKGTVNSSTSNTTTVNLFKGIIYGDVFGGGLGDAQNPAAVKGKVTVKLNDNNGTCVVTGSIFGCNNTNGSPEGDVEVHIYNTVHLNGTNVVTDDPETGAYELTAVYGGGKSAEYNASGKTAKVFIETCDPSIAAVYGGGFGADVPNTYVEVIGAHEIGMVFGGGYGAGSDNPEDDDYNPGANVNGTTTVLLEGGIIHEAYGGSNTKGDIVGGTNVDVTNSNQDCSLDVGKVYGGGRNARMGGSANVVLGCQPEGVIEEVYGGAEAADIDGNVELTITSGHYRNVYGGNKSSGLIRGSIRLNIEESKNCATELIIDHLYGCGNAAPYSVYGYYQDGTEWKPRTEALYNQMTAEQKTAEGLPYDDPEVHVVSFTKIGQVFGGGYGANAKVYGNPKVYINQRPNYQTENQTGESADKHVLGAIGPFTYTDGSAVSVDGGVYGGGSEANVYGNTTVFIGSTDEVEMHSLPKVTTDEGETYHYVKRYVEGANINCSVYGGGRLADVSGNTEVIIGANKVKSGDTYTYPATTFAGTSDTEVAKYKGILITGDVFGAGQGVNSDVSKALVSGNSIVVMKGGSVKKSVYGGGELSQVAGNTDITVAGGTVGTPNEGSNVYGGATYGNVYGGGKGNTTDVAAGLIKGDTKIAISDGTILHNIYGGGAYGSVGEFDYNETTGMPTGLKANTSGGKAEIYITGGIIGTSGQENGMIFGSSRGDVGGSGEIHDKLAWVYDTHVAVGDTTENATITTATPLIKGSVYGGGENGHNFRNAYVRINGGTIGIADSSDPYYTVTSKGKEYSGAEYLYRGNVYGGGCGTDKYYSNTQGVANPHDGNGDTYNPLAGIVQGNAYVNITAGAVVHNVYGAGAMGSVGKFEKNTTTNAITFTSGGKSTIAISGGTIGFSGTVGDGNVYGAARGDKDFTDRDLALVKETGVTISGTTTSTQIKGNVYGGGEVGNVQTNTTVDIQGGAIAKNVYGGGKGVEDLFTCEQAMVGVEGEGAGANLDTDDNKIKGTSVTVSNGMVGTLNNGTLVSGTGNVYGGGEIGRVEWNTRVTIGESNASGTSAAPLIYGSVFGAGKGLETHGYSALVRGNSTVIVQGNAKVEHNVYGGGEKSTVGRYWVKGINNIDSEGNPVPGAPDAPSDLPDGMPYQQQSGGICSVTVQGKAQIGPDAGASTDAGHVFGAGKGANPHFNASTSKKMTKDNVLVAFEATTTGKTAEDLYLEFLQTLALVTNSNVTIDGSATVKGSVYGGSESGFVQHNTDVDILGGTINGDAFGGGLGLASFAEAGKVKGNTDLTISGDAAVEGNVYGGGSLGDVGIIDKTDKKDGQLTYNYKWKQSDGRTANVAEYNIPSSTSTHDTSKNTGICQVTVSGGTIGFASTSEPTKHGNVFGAGRGSSTTWWCEKAIVYATNVSVTKGMVYGNVYGGGEVGRVEDDAKVTIGAENGTDEFTISGSVFGAGAGLATHGYSALVRGNAKVTVQGKAQIGGSVYGGGETASVGKFTVVGGLPKHPDSGGTCTVMIKDNAAIAGEVFGACKGVDPTTIASADRKSMQLATNAPSVATLWSHYNDDENSPFIWRYYPDEAAYLAFLETLALTSNTDVTINGSAIIGESVYGGGQRGVTLGTVKVDIFGGTVNKDVYGGGALANTNTGNWDSDKYVEATGLTVDESVVTGLYTRTSGSGTQTDPYVYTEVTAADAKAASGTTYYIRGAWADGKTSADYTTTVNLKGGMIKGDAYGGGLGQLGTNPIEAKVYGDVYVNQGTPNDDTAPATAYTITYLTDNTDTNKPLQVVNSGRIFGCNNLNGSPKGNVTVIVNRTVTGKDGSGNNITRTAIERDATTKEVTSVATPHKYEVAAVYGGGNLADYTPENGKVKVIINSCDVSIEEVYGGGNAAEVPETDVLVNGAHEIEHVFGGGNGEDRYYLNNKWNENPGANVNGNTNTLLKGGLIHEAYGGSNEKGTITGNVTIDTGTGGLASCPVQVDKLVAAGKNADVEGDLIVILGCKNSTKIPLVYGGADNANVKGNVELTITSGKFGKVFGGNNEGGSIFGHITLNIEETSECEPIRIDELYLGGNDAAYSRYGYYQDGTDANNKPIYKPRTAEMHSITDTSDPNYKAPVENPAEDATHTFPYAQPVLNVISATRIGQVFGGGYGDGGDMYADPIVNINMIPGYHAATQLGGADKLGAIGDVYGGGNAADVIGNTTINIGTATTVNVKSWTYDPTTKVYTAEDRPVKGANVTGNVYGGGKLADVGQYDVANDHVDVAGNTYVNIGAKYNETDDKWESVDGLAIAIAGNVFGGGQGSGSTFKCEKAMVTGGTNIHIGNGTIGTLNANEKLVEGTGTVYGGGEVGRVEEDTEVTIGIKLAEGATTSTSVPVIKGDVFGAGKGLSTHGYAALVRGHSTVTVQGGAQVKKNVYGGGEIASVGRYKVADAAYHSANPAVEIGLPYSLANPDNPESGKCIVNVWDKAVIGPDEPMLMTRDGGPDDMGHVFGAGKGVLPYEGYAANEKAWRMQPGDTAHPDGIVEEYLSLNEANDNNEGDYLKFIESMALATETYVTIGGDAFVKGSVYGGSENGHVQYSTNVTIQDNCQIGCGKNTTERHPDAVWGASYSVPEGTDLECASWTYDPSSGSPYDKFATYQNSADGKYYYDSGYTKSAEGGSYIAKDGHTYYGNVFGGGSGVVPYRPGKWHREAGSVGRNTTVNITGGHILTSVYGGNEQTDVGAYILDSKGQPTIPAHDGKCTVNMVGGTLGVPRTMTQIAAHPVTCYLFGAGKGDQRIFFNTWTNVIETEVNISGNAHIYGSTFGGAEDGHVIKDAVTNIGGSVTVGTTNYTHSDVIIGTTGTSYVDGNIFGGGRGFSGDAQTAGTVGGNIEVNIENGKILGSIYGGGRLASVGTMFTNPESEFYGQFKEDDDDGTYGHIAINISGGTIGNDAEDIKPESDNIPNTITKSDISKWNDDDWNKWKTYNQISHTLFDKATGLLSHSTGGNVFGGSMGRLTLLNGDINPLWPKLAQVKTSTIKITGGTIKHNVYGGGELGTVREDAKITIENGIICRDVYGGGYGSDDNKTETPITVAGYAQTDYIFTPMQWAGCVGGDTYIDISGGQVKKSVYGGGEMASVGIINYTKAVKNDNPENGFVLSWPYKVEYIPYLDGKPVGGATHVKVTGGRIGAKKNVDPEFDTDNGDVYGAGKGIAGDYNDYVFCANVRTTDVTINVNSDGVTPKNYEKDGNCITGAVYGGGENGHVMEDTKLTITNGLIGHSIYGGGSGKGTFSRKLLKIGKTAGSTKEDDYYTRDIYSITAGKVFGNTEVNVEGGHVVRNVYGGGNMGSVGKGNYAGGADDYSTAGYGEKLSGNLWTASGNFNPNVPVSSTNQPTTNADYFLSSGKCVVNITGGTIGYIDDSDPSNSMYPWNSTASLPYGNVFGGCRGESAPNISESPRYLYSPEFFVGYANETEVTIEGDNTKILGSVYGGGMDGHIRRDTHVIINGGEIGIPFDETNKGILGNDPNDIQWLARGNVYGAGSGIGKYKYDFNYDGAYTSTVTYNGKQTKEEDFSTSAGSVTRFTKVEVQSGTIRRNVYGGGSLASVGGPKIPPISIDPYRKGDATEGHGVGKQSLNQVIISGDATIGDADSYTAGYGGYVFGSSRGDENLSNPASYATAVWTDVSVQGGTIAGDVYGGGEVGSVRQSTEVKLTGGVVKHDAYGGGKGTTTVAANVGGDAVVKLNEGKGAGDTGAVVSRLFGANNLNGSPQGNTSVYVYATQSADSEHTTIGSKFAKHTDLETEGATSTYDVLAVYGGGNEAAYVPASPYTASNTTGARSQVIIEGCDLTSIKTVYGGGNAASVPETNVNIKSAYEIEDVFGGGNGKDKKSNGDPNPGADIGVYKNASDQEVRFGTGNVNVNTEGGYIHELFGASNQKGDIKGDVNLKMQQVGDCTLKIDKVYNAGRNADIEGNLISVLSCQPTEKVLEYYGGAENANVKGNVELTITNGWFGKVFAGNNQSGAILGHIKLNVEETGCSPIKIDELYGCGNDAAYSVYGYYVQTEQTEAGTGFGAVGETPLIINEKLVLLPRTSADDPHLPVKTFSSTEHTWTVYEGTSEEDTFKPYADPELNIVSATYIGKVFGGGYGENGTIYGNPTVNINMIPGDYASGVPAFAQGANIDVSDNTKNLGIIGDVFGGGNAADVIGDPVINIGTADKVKLHLSWDKAAAKYTMSEEKTVEGAYIAGSVYGAGKGLDDTFTCEKAMVGIDGDGVDHPDGGTTVNIANGMVLGNVYGGGEIGRVEKNTKVTIGLESGTGTPVVKGNVFGGGKGKETHGYSALVRGNPTVIVQGNAKIKKSVYGGGEIASVARYKVAETDEEAAANGVKKGMPYALKSANSGYCTVIVRDNAEIGPDGMQMTAADGPDDTGYVFGAGKGILPKVYTYADDEHKPKRMVNNGGTSEWEYFANEDAYIQFIQTLALATHTDVTISGNAFVKGSVYGGSENGLVQYDTDVKIEGGQIGCGKNTTERYGDEVWAADYTPTTDLDCPSWEYKAPFAPYDPYAKYKNPADGKYYYDAAFTQYAEGGASVATDGHTYYGNVFGGGSGSVPYFNTIEGRSEYLSSAGQVKGNTTVTISGGHILTNVYGGCEATNVLGTANVTMTGGTVGVPRTDERIIAHPLTGYLFGAGKGDQRIFFNKETNVNHSVVKIEGGKIYGSVYGGGEDGHVLGNVSMTIGKAGSTTVPTIGTKGTSYYDGNVFGGGRGFGGEALTAGNVGGAITLDIEGGEMLGSVYGGGRLASVGYGLYLTTETGYGVMRADDEYDGSYTNPSTDPAATFFNKGRGKITVNVKGGTIGNDETNAAYGGNVFGGSMGRLTKLDGSDFDDANHWSLLATVKQTTVNVSGGTIKRSVYGGGELGTVTTDAIVNVSGGTIGTTGKGGAEFGNVYGGGKGYVDPAGSNYITAGIIKGNTTVNISQADSKTTTIYHNIYGGGAYGSVGTFTYDANNVITGYTSGGKATISITGGAIGEDGNENGMIFGSSRGDVGAPGSIHDKLAWVYDTEVTINGGQINGSVYGGGENGHNYHDAVVNIQKGTIGISSGKPIGTYTDGGASYPYRGNVYGGGCGTDKYYEDPALETHDGNGQLYNLLAGIVRGDATINISGGTVVHNVYGAGAMGSVGITNADGTISGGQTTIKISGGTIGVDGTAGEGNVFGAARGSLDAPENDLALVSGNTSVSITGGTMYGNVYGGGELGYVGKYTTVTDATSGSKTNTWPANTGLCEVTINGGGASVKGHVFGAGKGSANTFECEPAMVHQTNVSIMKGTVNGNVYGGGQLGRVENNTAVTIGDGSSEPVIDGDVFGAGAGVATHGYSALVRGDSRVTVQGKAKVGGSVYGGGETASVGRFKVVNSLPKEPLSGGTCTVTIQDDAQIGTGGEGHVFGACKGVEPDYANNAGHVINTGESKSFANEAEYLAFLKTLALTSNTVVTIGGNTSVNGSVFGGGQRGITLGNVNVDMTGGTVVEDVYGGGALADTNTGNASDYGTSTESIGSTSTYTTAVNLTGGIIGGEAYGGGLGQKTGVNGETSDIEAIVYGDVLVELNKGVAEDAKGCIVDRIFGANNINGTPKGHVKVHVYSTQNKDLATIKDKKTIMSEETTAADYDMTGVFGGGNAADYVPVETDTKQNAEVIIEGCGLTSIYEVYGGGYGAATPGTDVLINGTHIIDKVFGGGYGAGVNNPGANVGFRTDKTPYGIGVVDGKIVDDKTKIAIVQLKAGKVNSVFGGSNSLGDIRNGASITTLTTDDTGAVIDDPCEILEVGELYGGGNEAVMEGGAEIVLRCMPDSWIGEVYAGARKADVGNDVSLTITSGKFEHVYGGNKSSGKIDGYVEVNIEECPTCGTPVIIGELYGGGNEAPYTLPESYGKDYQSPRVNVRAFTSIGTIYGGGKGEDAVVNGNPTVSINVGMVDGGGQDYAGETKSLDGNSVKLYPHEKNKIGVIGNVFGGGNAAKVNGSTNVFIGTESYVKLDRVIAGETNVDNYYTRSGEGTEASPYVYTKASGTALENTVYYMPVLGVDIQGNVYGGGNNAGVTGETNVVIGKKASE